MEDSTDQCVAANPSSNVAKLHEKVKLVKQNADLEAKYMTGEELLRSREADGVAKGIAQSICVVLSSKFQLPESLEVKIMSQKDVTILNNWLKFAATVSTAAEFESHIGA